MFVKYNESKSAKTPMETMAENRIYVTVNNQDKLISIKYYDNIGKRSKQIDISGKAHTINGKKELPHTHKGYEHDENGTKKVSKKEQRIIDKVKKLWYKKDNKDG